MMAVGTGMKSGIDASQRSLTSCLLISCRTVHLSGKEQTFHHFRLQRMFQLGGVEEVVFDGIARAVDLDISQSGNLPQGVQLNIHREGRGEAVQVHLVCVFALWLQEEQVMVTFREGDKLCLDGGTIAGSDRLNLPVVKWRVSQSAAQGLMYLIVGIADPAGALLQCAVTAHEAELVEVVFTQLDFHVFEMNRALVDADRCSCLHPVVSDAMTGNAFCEVLHGRFCNASALNHLTADVHQAVQEGSGCDDHALGIQRHAPDGSDPDSLSVFHDQFLCLVLPHIEVVGMVERPPPFPDELAPVALCAWTPHGWSLGAVEHAELDGGGICHLSHLTAQRVNLADYLSFGNATDGRVARHLGNLVHVHCHQTRLCSHVCRSCCSFTSSVPAADDYYIVF